MIRTLIFEEFVKKVLRATVFAVAAAMLALGAKTMMLRWLNNDQVQNGFANTVTIAILLVAACAGGSAFAKPFREGPMRLLDVLPIQRAWVWLVRVLTSFVSAGVGIALLLMVQPSLITGNDSESIFLVTGIALLLFSLACSISSLIRSPTLGSTILAILLGFLVIALLAAVEIFVGYNGGTQKGFIAGVLCGGVLPPVSLTFSLIIFTRGELDVPRRRWRNVAVGVPLLLCALAFAVVVADAGVFEMGSPWKTLEMSASNSGTYVAAIQLRGNYSPQFRALVLETATGNVLKTYEGQGAVGLAWTPEDTLLVFTKSSTLRYLLHFGSETVSALRVFPTEAPIFHRTQYSFAGAASDERGTLLLLRDATFLASTSHSLLLRIDSSGHTKELLRVQGIRANTPILERAFDGGALLLGKTLWRIRDDVTEMTHNIGHFRFANAGDTQRASAWLQDNRPPPHPGMTPGKYLRDDTVQDFADSSWLYYIQADPQSRSARIWGRRKSDAAWLDVLSGIPLTDLELKDIAVDKRGLFTLDSYRAVRAGTRTGIVAALLPQQPDQVHLVVYDMNSRQRYDLGDMNRIPGEGNLRVNFPRFLRSVITISRNSFANRLPGGFYFEPGKGPPLRLTEPADPFNNIKFMEGGAHIYYTGNVDAGFDIFYQKPGEKPRLLLAAQSSFR